MKLWLKQTLLALTIILVTVSACLYFFAAVQTDSLLNQARESGLRGLTAFCEHLSTLDNTAAVMYDTDEITKVALIQYTFSTYAHLLQSAASAYSLAGEKGYLYNIAPSDPLALLPMTERDISASRAITMNDAPFLVQGARLRVLGVPLAVYLTQDISRTYQSIAGLTRAAQIALGVCLALCGTLLPLVFCQSLRPLRLLTGATHRIAGGEYSLRAGIHSPDEVGALSASFDRMAETVEQKIASLEDTARRRELLLGALTHEMKTPMTAIVGFSHSLLTMPLDEEKRMDAAGEIYQAARRTERLSQKLMQLISMADCPALVKRACDVAALFARAEQAVAPQLKQKNITLETRAQASALLGDGDLLFALLTNLLDNAAKASPQGSVIALSAIALGDRVRLQVADRGCGIPADKLPLVTEPFYRVDKARSRKQGGAGLGLSICRMIAKAHGAALVIQSRMGEGTTVYADFPDPMEGDDHE